MFVQNQEGRWWDRGWPSSFDKLLVGRSTWVRWNRLNRKKTTRKLNLTWRIGTTSWMFSLSSRISVSDSGSDSPAPSLVFSSPSLSNKPKLAGPGKLAQCWGPTAITRSEQAEGEPYDASRLEAASRVELWVKYVKAINSGDSGSTN